MLARAIGQHLTGTERACMDIQPSMTMSRATRRAFGIGLLRAAFSTLVVLVAYFVLPLDGLSDVSVFVLLPVALVAFAGGIAFEVRGILAAERPAVRAIEALARVVPIFLVLFASTYYVMATAEPSWYSEHLSRLDALYFAVTIFATVGFGDITAV